MSEKAIKKCKYILYILEAPKNLRIDILQNSSKTLLNLFCEVVLNIKTGNLFDEDFLHKYKKEVKSILRKSGGVKKKQSFVANLPSDFFSDLSIILKRYV
jgi:hypothetical protein